MSIISFACSIGNVALAAGFLVVNATVLEPSVTWNNTTTLDLLFLTLAAVLLLRFSRTGGKAMLAMMNGPPSDPNTSHDHSHHHLGAAGPDPETSAQWRLIRFASSDVDRVSTAPWRS